MEAPLFVVSVADLEQGERDEVWQIPVRWLGALLDGTSTLDQLEEGLFGLILEVASGRTLASNEKNGYREIAIWKEGVTL